MKENDEDYTIVSRNISKDSEPALVEEINEFQNDYENYIRRTNDLESANDRTLQEVEQENELIARIVSKLGITEEVYELQRLRDIQTQRFRDLVVNPSSGVDK